MAREKSKPEEPEGDPNAWMATFSDLVTLLITFFVLILSMSSLDAKTMDETFGFFNGRLGALGTAIEPTSRMRSIKAPQAPIMPSLKHRDGTPRNLIRFESEPDEMPTDEVISEQELKLSPDVREALEHAEQRALDQKVDHLLPFGTGATNRERFEKVVAVLKQERYSKLFQVRVEDDKILLHFAGDLLFIEGRVRIQPESLVLLKEIARLIQKVQLETRVLGVVPARRERAARPDLYPSGWELAIARGCNVVRYMRHNTSVPPNLLSCAVLPPSPTTEGGVLSSGVVFEMKTIQR